MTPEQAIGSALAAIDRLRDYGMAVKRHNRYQAFGAIALRNLEDAGYVVVSRHEWARLREKERAALVERIRTVAPPRCACGHRMDEHGPSGCVADDEAAMGGCACDQLPRTWSAQGR